MAFMDFVKKQFVDVIHWTEEEDGVLAYRFPMQDMEIQYGAQLTVRESQAAIFVNEGKVADVFGPGRYKLTTQTLPVLTNLNHWDKLFESPFKSDVYFFSTRLQVDQKWGTQNPITIRDKEFGAVRLRAFGIYSYRIAEPKAFYLSISGTRERYEGDELAGQLRSTVIASLTDLIAECGTAFLDLASQQDELAAKLAQKVGDNFKAIGLELAGFVLENISLPEELQKMLDLRIGMNVVGDMQRYTQFQVASNIEHAAKNEGGLAGIGAGLATGVAMGQQMAQAMGAAISPHAGAPAANGAPQGAQDVVGLIEKLGELKAKGVLTDEEFAAKKAELLKKLG